MHKTGFLKKIFCTSKLDTEDRTRRIRTNGAGGRAGQPPSPAHLRSAEDRPDLRSPAGASAAAGARAEPTRAAALGPARATVLPLAPPPAAAPRAARAQPTQRAARPRAPGPARGDAGNGCAGARPGTPRAPPRPPAHGGRADKGAFWRPRSAAVGGLNPAPELTFRGAERLLFPPSSLEGHTARSPVPPSPRADPDSWDETPRNRAGGHLRHNRRGTPGPSRRHPAGEDDPSTGRGSWFPF